DATHSIQCALDRSREVGPILILGGNYRISGDLLVDSTSIFGVGRMMTFLDGGIKFGRASNFILTELSITGHVRFEGVKNAEIIRCGFPGFIEFSGCEKLKIKESVFNKVSISDSDIHFIDDVSCYSG